MSACRSRSSRRSSPRRSRILRRHLLHRHVGHVGDGNFHLGLCIDPNSPAELAEAEAANERLVRRASPGRHLHRRARRRLRQGQVHGPRAWRRRRCHAHDQAGARSVGHPQSGKDPPRAKLSQGLGSPYRRHPSPNRAPLSGATQPGDYPHIAGRNQRGWQRPARRSPCSRTITTRRRRAWSMIAGPTRPSPAWQARVCRTKYCQTACHGIAIECKFSVIGDDWRESAARGSASARDS